MHVLMSDEAEALAQLFRALSDPNRLRLLSALEDGERCVHELVKAMEMTQPAVSQQLRLLRDLGVVRGRRQGRQQGAEVTKDALRIIASAAPDPVAQSDVVKGLTGMGYKATDATKDAVIAGLDSIEEATGGGVVRQVSTAGRKAVYEMNSQIAKQLLKNLMG